MSLISDSYISFVNLSHRTDRLKHIQDQFNKVGLIAERTPGIYPHELDLTNPKYAKMVNRTIGATGCYESQLNVMKKALSLNKHAMIFEDDVVLCEDFVKRLEYIENWQSIKHNISAGTKSCIDWQVVWLGGTFHVGGNRGPYWHTKTLGHDASLTDDPRMLRSYGSFSTYAYLVSKDHLENVIKKLEDFMPNSIGIDYSFIKLAPEMFNYVFVPGCCKQIDNESDQNPGSGEWTMFSKFSKLNGTIENSAYWFQERMEDFDPYTFDWAEANIGNNFLTKND